MPRIAGEPIAGRARTHPDDGGDGVHGQERRAVPHQARTVRPRQAGRHPGLRDNPPPEKLAREIGQNFKRSKYLKPSYWIESGKRSAKREGASSGRCEARPKKDGLVEGRLRRRRRRTSARHRARAPCRRGRQGAAGHGPAQRDSGGVDVARESYWQTAIPLEYRWISKQYKIAELDDAMYEIVKDVRKANRSTSTRRTRTRSWPQ